MHKLRAFTLIELLVTISLIALLIALLLPALVKSRDSIRDTGCLSNIRAQMQAQIFHTVEYDQLFPKSGEWIWGKGSLADHPDGKLFNGSTNFQNHHNDYTTREAPRYGVLANYIDNFEAHFCPLANRLPATTVKNGKPKNSEVVRSYVMNWNAGPWWNVYKQFDEESMQTIDNAAEFVVVGEENTFKMGFGGGAIMNDGAMGYTWDHFGSFHRLQATDDLRSGYSAAGFADGSADWIFPQARVPGPNGNGRVSATEAWASDDIENPADPDLSIVQPLILN